MKTLIFLNFLSELFQLVFELGVFTRRHIVPALVYVYVVLDYYVKPSLSIPYYFIQIRSQRLSYS